VPDRPSDAPGRWSGPDGTVTAEEVLALVDRRSGARPVLCLDGPAGSGKTTLAAALAAARPGTAVVHLDDLLAGWHGGLRRMSADLVADVLAPYRAGRPARFRRYDWHAGRFTGLVPVPTSTLLVVEGVGAGSRLTAPYRDGLVWVEAPPALRRARGIARDGDAFAPYWDRWARDEDALFTADRTRRGADLALATG
jgi:hypothetical protein